MIGNVIIKVIIIKQDDKTDLYFDIIIKISNLGGYCTHKSKYSSVRSN